MLAEYGRNMAYIRQRCPAPDQQPNCEFATVFEIIVSVVASRP
jgi:hypothetical protein